MVVGVCDEVNQGLADADNLEPGRGQRRQRHGVKRYSPPNLGHVTHDPFRLPRTVAPRRYDVMLDPDLERASFTGRARIDIEVLEPTNELVLNAAELGITGCSVDQTPASFSLDDDNNADEGALDMDDFATSQPDEGGDTDE